VLLHLYLSNSHILIRTADVSNLPRPAALRMAFSKNLFLDKFLLKEFR